MNSSVIWKFSVRQLDKEGVFGVEVPLGARVLTFGHDTEGEFSAWAEIASYMVRRQQENPGYTEMKRYLVVPTGAEFDYKGEYVQTIFVDSGPMFPLRKVFHIYRMDD